MNIGVKANIHNRFDIWKENVETGKKEQLGYAENIILNQMWTRLCGADYYFRNIHYGTGTGTLDPTRTSLFAYLGTAAAVTVTTVKAIPTSYWQRSITLGLTTANGQTLTEVGISYDSSSTFLVTHALIRDMNGNPTSIPKTSVDIITIYATVYVTLINDHADINLVEPSKNQLLDYLLGGSFTSGAAYAGMLGDAVDWTTTGADGCYGTLGFRIGSASTTSTSWTADVANKKLNLASTRFNVDNANGHIAEIAIARTARARIPSGIYGGLELTDVPVGTGDASIAEFELPSNNIDKATIVVKADGVIVSSYTLEDIAVLVPYAHTLDAVNRVAISGEIIDTDILVTVDKYTSNVGTPALRIYKLQPWGLQYIKGQNMATSSLDGWPKVFGVSKNNLIAAAYNYTGAGVFAYDKAANTLTTRAIIEDTNTVDAVYITYDGKYVIILPYHYPYTYSPYIRVHRWTGTEYVADLQSNASKPTCGACSPVTTEVIFSKTSYPYVFMLKEDAGTMVVDSTFSLAADHPLATGAPSAITYSRDGQKIFISYPTGVAVLEKVDGLWEFSSTLSFEDIGYAVKIYDTLGDYAVGTGASYPTYYNVILYKLIGTTYKRIAYMERHDSYGDGLQSIRFMSESILAVARALNYNYTTPNVFLVTPRLAGKTKVVFSTPPSEGAVLTANYTVNGIHKTTQRVIDVTGSIQFGEPT